jgi:hypothetical protein
MHTQTISKWRRGGVGVGRGGGRHAASARECENWLTPRLGASLDYKANRVGFATPPAHPTPRLRYIFIITPNGVAVLRCPAAHFLRSSVAGRCPAYCPANAHAVLQPIFLRSSIAGRCPACYPANAHALPWPSFCGHPLQDDVPPSVLRTPMLPCGAFFAVIRCRTMSRRVSRQIEKHRQSHP